MAKFLLKALYTVEGTLGLLKEGGSSRKNAVQQLLRDLGGTLESFYYAFGKPDAFAIIDVPDAVTACALSLAINSTGAVQVSITALITPEEIDAACKKSVKYRAPGRKS
jgi:uncharacterized protein with GYD domain